MNLGMPEMIFIFLLALVVVGPKRLPELARQLGKWTAEFKRASNEFKNQLETEMMNIELDERARKQTEASKALPPEKPWEPAILPPVGVVSRSTAEAIPEPESDGPLPDPPALPSMNQPPTPVRSTPDA
ncbi:MAG: Sec-independent protein translocase protein TatB [Candidatus Korobacteraceae bacterium]